MRDLIFFDKRNAWFAFFAIVCGYLFLGLSLNVYADDSIVNKQLDTKEFVLDASIDKSKIRDGTPDFDADDNPGHDSSAHNGIVRIKDTVTIPLKLTINPKKDIIKKLRVKMSLLVSDPRKKATEQIEVYSTIANISQTSTAVYTDLNFEVPIGVTNFDLNPTVKIEVLKVNDKDIILSPLYFRDFMQLKTSGRADVRLGMSDVTLRSSSFVHSGITVPDNESLFTFGLSFFEKNNGRGVAIPDELTFEIATEGEVNFDLPQYQDLVFTTEDTPIRMFDFIDRFSEADLHPHSDSDAFLRGDIYRLGGVYVNNLTRVVNKDGSVEYSETPSVAYSQLFLSKKAYVPKSIIPQAKIILRFEGHKIKGRITDFTYIPDGSYGSDAMASIGLILRMPDDYTLGGKNNVEKKVNTEFYRFISTLKTVDKRTVVENGDTKTSKTIQRRNFASDGNIRGHGFIYGDYRLSGRYDINDKLTARQTFAWGFNYGDNLFKGGFDLLLKTNPESFEYDYMSNFSRSCEFNTYHNKKVKYGIAKDTNNKFEAFIAKEKDAYIWYDTFKEASEKGKVSAVLYQVFEPNNITNTEQDVAFIENVYIGNRLGSKNESGTYNVTQGIMYLYRDEKREEKPYVYGSPTALGRFNNPLITDDTGLNVIKPQSPRDSLSTFDTANIQIAPMQATINIDAVKSDYIDNRGIYYNQGRFNIEDNSVYKNLPGASVADLNINDVIYLPMTMYINYPKAYGVDGVKNVVTVNLDVPRGLQYIDDSIHNVAMNKKVLDNALFGKDSWYQITNRKVLDDGFERLTMDILLEDKLFYKVDKHNFGLYPSMLGLKFKVLPTFFDGSNSFVKKMFKASIGIHGDSSRSYAYVSVSGNRLYLLSVLEEIESKSQKRNQSFSIDINPFTTNERESNVRGAFHVPANNDENGSRFAGELKLKNIETKHSKEMNVYVNKQRLDVSNVLNIDISRDGWVKYVDGMDLNGIQSVYYEIPGVITVADDLRLKLNFETKGNHTGDTYIHTSYVNSDNRYRISPQASKVSYVVDDVPPLKVDFSKIQIRTKPKEEGLDVDVYTNKAILDDSGKEVSFKVELWDNTLNQKVTEKDYTGDSLPEKISFKVPSELLKRDGQQHNYEARLVDLEGSDAKINTDGYTSSKKIVRLDDLKDHLKDDTYVYRSVIMTERYKGKDINRYYEEIKVPIGKPYRNKTGYAIDLKPFGMSYQNDLQEFGSIANVKVELSAEKGLVEKVNIKAENWFSKYVELQVERTFNDFKASKMSFDVELPEVSVRQNDGAIDLAKNVKTKTNYYNGGRRLYVPIWTKLKNYELVYDLSNHKIGVNQVSVMLTKHVDVYAYMYNPAESNSVIHDELMLKPNMQR